MSKAVTRRSRIQLRRNDRCGLRSVSRMYRPLVTLEVRVTGETLAAGGPVALERLFPVV